MHCCFEAVCEDSTPFIAVADLVAQFEDQKEYLEERDSCGLTPLHVATLHRSSTVACALLNLGADVKALTANGFSVLHICGQYGDREITDVLIRRGAEVNAVDKDNWTPLHVCSSFEKVEVAKRLLQAGASVNTKNMDQWTSLHISAEKGSTQVARVLLDYGADINASGKDSWRPLHLCAQEDSSKIATVLLEKGADMELPNNKQQTPLHICAYQNAMATAKILLKQGANTEAVDKNKRTPLHFSAIRGTRGVADMLLEHGANKDAEDKTQQTPVHLCAEYNTANTAEALLRRNANTLARDKDQCTPLHLCAKHGSIDVAWALLADGVENQIDAVNRRQLTALHLSAKYGTSRVALALLERGASVNACSADKRTALHIAAEKGHVEIVKALMERGANPELQDRDADTALHLAVENRHLDVVGELVRIDPERIVNIAGTMGHSPLHIAVIVNTVSIAQVLIEAGASVSSKDHRGMTPCDFLKDDQEAMRRLLMPPPELVRSLIGMSRPDKSLHATEDDDSVLVPTSRTVEPQDSDNVIVTKTLLGETVAHQTRLFPAYSCRSIRRFVEFIESDETDAEFPISISLSGVEDSSLSKFAFWAGCFASGPQRRVLKKLESLKLDTFANSYVIKTRNVIGNPFVFLARRMSDPKRQVFIKFYEDEHPFEDIKSLYSGSQGSHLSKMLECLGTEKTGCPPSIVIQKGVCTLEEWLEAERSLADKKRCLHEALTGLKELHERHYVHGNLDPANIMFFEEETKWKLTDWDEGWKVGAETIHIPAVSPYTAPELIAPFKEEARFPPADPAWDIWSFGIIAYEALSGEPFFDYYAPLDDMLTRLQNGHVKAKLSALERPAEEEVLSKFLVLDSKERWSAAEALQHSFFSSDGSGQGIQRSLDSDFQSADRHSFGDQSLDNMHVDDLAPNTCT